MAVMPNRSNRRPKTIEMGFLGSSQQPNLVTRSATGQVPHVGCQNSEFGAFLPLPDDLTRIEVQWCSLLVAHGSASNFNYDAP